MATSTRDNSVSFGERLRERAAERGRLCVGIDPHAGLLQDWGLANDIAGLREFSRRCVDAFADTACVVKPQVAFMNASVLQVMRCWKKRSTRYETQVRW